MTIPTGVHEQLHGTLYKKIDRKIDLMGLETAWTLRGSERLRPQGHPGGDGGEGDSAGGPDPERLGLGTWPTLVIEAGDSESLTELHNDMRWWFSASNHDVNIILLAKFDHGQDKILVERWEEEGPPPRQGATTTRFQPRLQPVLQQSITITRDTTTNPTSYNVASGALVLEFRLLFLRDPGPGEGDVVVGIPELQGYASKVWAYIED